MHIPIGASEDYTGLVDVLTGKQIIYKEDKGSDVDWEDASPEYAEQIKELDPNTKFHSGYDTDSLRDELDRLEGINDK